jgi:hypothetical protein
LASAKHWLLLALAVALSGAAAGCEHGGSATVSARELSTLVLQPSDMRGYSQFDEGKQVSLDARPGPREDPARFGRTGGWKARYRATAAAQRGAVVESRADRFGDVAGAKKDLAAYREELATPIPGSGATLRALSALPRLGDDAVGSELRQGPSVIYTVAWREANATASVAIQGPAAQTRPSDLYRIARIQARRLRRAADK